VDLDQFCGDRRALLDGRNDWMTARVEALTSSPTPFEKDASLPPMTVDESPNDDPSRTVLPAAYLATTHRQEAW